MDRNDGNREAELIELGTASVVTKGGQGIALDDIGDQVFGGGISDD